MGKRKGFYKVQLEEMDHVELFQDNVERVLGPLVSSEIWDGVLLRGIELTAGNLNRVKHKLGRDPVGYIVVGRDVNAAVWDNQKSNEQRSLFLDLQTDVDCTISLWVF